MSSIPLIYKPLARIELIKIYNDLEKARPGYGELFLEDVDNAIERIFIFPQAYREITPGIRMCRLSKFRNFALFYEMEPERLVIFAIFDGRQDPGKLSDRI